MFVIAVEFTLKREAAAQFLTRVRQQAADSLEKEPGCRRFDVCTDPADPARVFLYELYDDEAAFGAHQQMPHYHAFTADVTPWIADKKVDRWALDD